MNRKVRAINIMEAQNRNIQIFIETFESGRITEDKYKTLVQGELEQARKKLAELN